MKIDIQDSFSEKLSDVVDFIAEDKPKAARKFKTNILKEINKLAKFPFQYKKSMYFENDLIRDMVFKGYTVIYRVNPEKNMLLVFGLIKHQESLDQ